MKTIFDAQIEFANTLNLTEKFTHLSNVLRSLLQCTCITLLEITYAETNTDSLDFSESLERFTKPSDGMPVEIIDSLVPHLRQYIARNFANGWFESVKPTEKSLSYKLNEWVTFRNSKPGHGVLDQESITEWAPKINVLIKSLMTVFSETLPKVEGKKNLTYLPTSKLIIDFPLVSEGKSIVIREVIQRKGNWKLKYQPLDFHSSPSLTTSLSDKNIFSQAKNDYISDYKILEVEICNKDYIIEHNIPVRQTDTFTGRDKEKELIKEWLDDDEDSRRCLVYGDGGYGKTTLVLEVLNQLIEGEVDLVKAPPSLICFYTAKLTKWTDNGLVRFSSIQPAMDECVREIVKCFMPKLEKSWYTTSGIELINKAAGYLAQKGVSRNNLLLIIDNSETLSNSAQGNSELADFFKIAGKKLGRLLITSRRHEGIEAAQIMIEGLKEKDSVILLKSLAETYQAESILKAGERKLSITAQKLMYKPLLLEALVVYIARSRTSIDSAMDNLYKKSDNDLLEFLYEDAWARLVEMQKDIFYILICISGPLNSTSIGQACQLAETQHIEFQESLRETHFATITDFGSHYELELIELAKRFFEKKLSELAPLTREKFRKLAVEVDRYATEKARIDLEYKEDRVSEAFRSEFSKIAKIAVDNHDYDRAYEYYLLAVDDDPLNSALHDRFAWFLSHKVNRIDKALIHAQRAIELNPKNCDATVNLALIHYRLKNLTLGDKLIDSAKLLGRTDSFCFLRKAIARYYMGLHAENKEFSLKFFEEGKRLLISARKSHNPKSPYSLKVIHDIKKYENLILRKIYLANKK